MEHLETVADAGNGSIGHESVGNGSVDDASEVAAEDNLPLGAAAGDEPIASPQQQQQPQPLQLQQPQPQQQQQPQPQQREEAQPVINVINVNVEAPGGGGGNVAPGPDSPTFSDAGFESMDEEEGAGAETHAVCVKIRPRTLKVIC